MILVFLLQNRIMSKGKKTQLDLTLLLDITQSLNLSCQIENELEQIKNDRDGTFTLFEELCDKIEQILFTHIDKDVYDWDKQLIKRGFETLANRVTQSLKPLFPKELLEDESQGEMILYGLKTFEQHDKEFMVFGPLTPNEVNPKSKGYISVTKLQQIQTNIGHPITKFAFLCHAKSHWTVLYMDTTIGKPVTYYFDSFGGIIDELKPLCVSIVTTVCKYKPQPTDDLMDQQKSVIFSLKRHQDGSTVCGLHVLNFIKSMVIKGESYDDYSHTKKNDKDVIRFSHDIFNIV